LNSRIRSVAVLGLILLVCAVAFGGQLCDQLTDVDVQPLILTGLFHSVEDVWSILTTPFMQGRMVNGLFWRPFTSLLLFAFVRRLWRELDRSGGEWIAVPAALLFAIPAIGVLFCLCCHPGQGAAGLRRKLSQSAPLVRRGGCRGCERRHG